MPRDRVRALARRGLAASRAFVVLVGAVVQPKDGLRQRSLQVVGQAREAQAQRMSMCTLRFRRMLLLTDTSGWSSGRAVKQVCSFDAAALGLIAAGRIRCASRSGVYEDAKRLTCRRKAVCTRICISPSAGCECRMTAPTPRRVACAAGRTLRDPCGRCRDLGGVHRRQRGGPNGPSAGASRLGSGPG